MSFEPGNRLIAALDVPGGAEARELCTRLDGAASWLKIGLELFISEGPALVRAMAETNSIMLDLKLHDIPATVGRSTAAACRLGAGLLTVHAGGGSAMLRAAAEASRAAATSDHRTRILAVTVLTSLNQEDLAEVGINGDPTELVCARARLASDAGCDGVVASPMEVERIRAVVPPDFLIVTPGVRPAGASAGDQKRVATPARARAAGADMVVVGRPIRDADDPAEAARRICSELAAQPG